MLRISRRTDYAVRVMIAAASVPGGEYVPSPRIGDEMNIPHPFLVKVVGDLRRSGLLTTSAGRMGGVKLSRSVESITLRHIVEAVEGPIQLNQCLVKPGECVEGELCPAHRIWASVQQSLRDALDAVTLTSLVQVGYMPGSDDTPISLSGAGD